MHCRQACNTGTEDALQSTKPQFQVGINGILDQHSDLVMPLQLVGDVLNGKWIGCCASTHPQDIDARIKGRTDMLDGSHLGSHKHSRLAFHPLKPRQAFIANALKTSRLGSWFPEPCPKNLDTRRTQRPSRIQRLFFGFGTARACNDNGTTALYTRYRERCYFL